MLVVSSDKIEETEIVETLGMVKGNTIRAKHLGKDIVAALRNLVGGEIKEYTEMMSDAREQAVNRMVEQAEKLGADAIINVRFTTSMVMSGASEFLAYGTAVKTKDKK
jgi:uncharacterized protein YbjQ (UPF0145 family)